MGVQMYVCKYVCVCIDYGLKVRVSIKKVSALHCLIIGLFYYNLLLYFQNTVYRYRILIFITVV